ncbi:dynactin subunit 4 [Drosophila grimshawi]|uniref:Dynactin subunit 4 n=1 Tax=Drosophila grimshawi TaxID=7222 RepID=B4J7Z7_DROGR|nr:dynactin subunit 4 [Drosophila grimshawi]EDW02227.1 GH20017 [Drosophila grimshawi]
MSFMQPSPVKYACSCGILNPINKLFFCRHCPKLRCGFCVCHEIESHFCSNCLENIPSSEARHKKNCCANCFDCPCCQHTLSARATTVPVVRKADESKDGGESGSDAAPSPKPSAMPTTKKMYYLSCLSCRWTTRDVGIPDQGVATGTWPDNECLYQVRFNTLMEYYQSVVLQEKQEKQEFMRRKAPKQHKFPSLTDRTGLTVSLIRRQIGWNDKSIPKTKPINITPAEASAEVEPLSEDIFTQPINLRNVTTVAQRHSQPADQPTAVNNLYPQRRSLWIKRSLRCRHCEHNLIKPEYHPTSIKYRIQLFASYHVPEVVMVRCEQPLQPGQTNAIFLKFTNPTMYDMTISILDAPPADAQVNMDAFMQGCRIKEEAITSSPLLKATGVTLTRQNSTREVTREVRDLANATIVPLDNEFVLSQRDDSKEFDEDVQAPIEEPKFIVWRKGNKVLMRLQFTPAAELQTGDEVTLGFYMQYTYVNTVSNTPDKKEPTTHALYSRLFIQAGEIAQGTAN